MFVTPRPYRPDKELIAALDRGDLEFSIALAREVAEGRQRLVDFDVALAFLPLVATQRPDAYDGWACRWMARWLSESGGTIDQAVDVAASLAALPVEPEAIQTIRRALS